MLTIHQLLSCIRMDSSCESSTLFQLSHEFQIFVCEHTETMCDMLNSNKTERSEYILVDIVNTHHYFALQTKCKQLDFLICMIKDKCPYLSSLLHSHPWATCCVHRDGWDVYFIVMELQNLWIIHPLWFHMIIYTWAFSLRYGMTKKDWSFLISFFLFLQMPDTSPTKSASFFPDTWYRKAYEENTRSGTRPAPEGAGSMPSSTGTPSPGSGISSPGSFSGSPGTISPGIGTESPGSLGGSPGFGTGSPASGSGSSPGSERAIWCENCNARLAELKGQALKLLIPGPYSSKVTIWLSSWLMWVWICVCLCVCVCVCVYMLRSTASKNNLFLH